MSSLHFTVSCETDGEYGQRVNIREAQAINLFDINVKSGEAWRRRGKTSVVDISHTKERHRDKCTATGNYLSLPRSLSPL